MVRKSLFTLKKTSDRIYPYSVAFQGIGVTRHRTKTEALKKLVSSRKKERIWLKKNLK